MPSCFIPTKWKADFHARVFAMLRICGMTLVCIGGIYSQKLAVFSPETNPQAEKYAESLADSLSRKLIVIDAEMSQDAFRSVKLQNPYNLTTAQSKDVGSVIGCDHFLLVKTGTLRRTSFDKDEFYESFVNVFLVDGRSGRLIHWELKSFEADTPAESEQLLLKSSSKFVEEILGQLETSRKSRSYKGELSGSIEEVPLADSAAAKHFRPPMPYMRIKPEYTRQAYLYDVRATVDASVDIDQNGEVIGIQIERWAGFGLDESVAEAIRKMNWRPAERNGKTLPMRVLLRYNFTKIEKE